MRNDKSNSAYRIDNLTTGYGRKVLLRKFSACLRSGEITCLIGVNGAGKSTLLRTLSGLQPKLGGSIELRGKALADYDIKDLARTVSVVLTDEILEQNLTAYELVAMGRMPYTGYWGTLLEHDRRIVDHSLSLVGMQNFAARRIHSLSDGERQKLMIAKALAQDTPVILLDEPVAFLDFPSKVAVLKLLRRVARQQQKAILLSIHDIELALQVADRLWVLVEPKLASTIDMNEAGASRDQLVEQDFMEGEPREMAQAGRLDFLFHGKDIVFDRESLQYKLKME